MLWQNNGDDMAKSVLIKNCRKCRKLLDKCICAKESVTMDRKGQQGLFTTADYEDRNKQWWRSMIDWAFDNYHPQDADAILRGIEANRRFFKDFRDTP